MNIRYPIYEGVYRILTIEGAGKSRNRCQEHIRQPMGKHVTGPGNRPEPCKTENAVLYPETALRLRCAHSGHQRKNFLISSKRIMTTKR